MIRLAMILWLGLAAVAQAEAIVAQGLHSDRDFYRVISCGAVPGEACKKPHKRWSVASAADLTIGLQQVHPGYPEPLRDMVVDAFEAAVAEINAAGAEITLRWVQNEKPAIRVYLVNTPHSGTMDNTGFSAFDGQRIANARVVSNRKGALITFAAIAMSATLDPSDIRSIALEETFQALGFIYDIDNPDYAPLSILYERDSLLNGLGPQDIAALRTKYAY